MKSLDMFLSVPTSSTKQGGLRLEQGGSAPLTLTIGHDVVTASY